MENTKEIELAKRLFEYRNDKLGMVKALREIVCNENTYDKIFGEEISQPQKIEVGGVYQGFYFPQGSITPKRLGLKGAVEFANRVIAYYGK